MRPISAWFALVVSLSGYACQTEAQTVATPTADRPPAWQQQMEEARRLAAAGKNYAMVVTPVQAGGSGSGGVYVFYNNPRPFCYTYNIPGDWDFAREPNAYRSKDGRALAGVLFMLPKDLEGVKGATLVERAGNLITLEYERTLAQPLAGVELIPFESARPGTWRWRAAPVSQAGRQIVFPAKIIIDLSPDAVAQITVAGASDNDDLARRIVKGLRTTLDPECYWPLLESMLKSVLKNR